MPDTNRTRAIPAERTHSDSQIQPQNSLPSRAKSWYRPRDEQGAKVGFFRKFFCLHCVDRHFLFAAPDEYGSCGPFEASVPAYG